MILTLIVVSAQSDGNPHNWDRRRRCDQIDYDPPVEFGEVCLVRTETQSDFPLLVRTEIFPLLFRTETQKTIFISQGYGGIPTGDKNEQITLTTCEPAPNQPTDPSKLIKPVWGPDFYTSNYNEILIGPKTDPFCFQVFPSNSSKGELCYRHDSGSQSYYMSAGPGKGGLYEQLKVDSIVGTIETTLFHQGQDFWIINKFPWYAAGVHQCICARAREGGDSKKPAIYPVQYNWTQQMFYVGREIIGVEYGNGNQTLDHWAFGPHHVWSKPEVGQAVRGVRARHVSITSQEYHAHRSLIPQENYSKIHPRIQTRTPTLEHRYVCGNLSTDFRSFRRAREMRPDWTSLCSTRRTFHLRFARKVELRFESSVMMMDIPPIPRTPRLWRSCRTWTKTQQQRLISSEQRRSFRVETIVEPPSRTCRIH